MFEISICPFIRLDRLSTKYRYLDQAKTNDVHNFQVLTLVKCTNTILAKTRIVLSKVIGHIRVRCTINRSHSTPCKKAEFEHLQIFPGHCLDFFLSVSGKICHSPIKKVKRQPTLIISFSQHSPFFGEQSKNPG